MKYTRFKDIPPFTHSSSYQVNVSWTYIEDQLKSMANMGGVELDPDFQREHVWSEVQQIRYVEFCLRGGTSGRNILWNGTTFGRETGDSSSWDPIVLVDGKQRLQAVRRFMRNEIPAFGTLRNDYEDKLRMVRPDFIFHINDLKTRAEVLQWYLEQNASGTPHTDDEIARVRALLEAEKPRRDRHVVGR